MEDMGGMSSMERMSSMGGMEDMGGNVGMGAIGTPMSSMPTPGGFMSMVSPIPPMPTLNDGCMSFPPIHSTPNDAHTTKVQNEDEEQDGDAKEDGDDE
jgi:hypothetical protein